MYTTATASELDFYRLTRLRDLHNLVIHCDSPPIAVVTAMNHWVLTPSLLSHNLSSTKQLSNILQRLPRSCIGAFLQEEKLLNETYQPTLSDVCRFLPQTVRVQYRNHFRVEFRCLILDKLQPSQNPHIAAV
jgi:hypothetical protein